MLVRVASAYRTVSAGALQVITGTPPIYILAEGRRNLYAGGEGQNPERNMAARDSTLEKWQREWDGNHRVEVSGLKG